MRQGNKFNQLTYVVIIIDNVLYFGPFTKSLSH